MRKTLWFLCFAGVLCVSLFIAPLASAQVETGPGPNQAPGPYDNDPLLFIDQVYKFSLAIAGLLAFGMIVYGGFQYTVAAGNPSGQSDARDRITQALIGVLLIFGSWLLLNTINPAITQLSLPNLSAIKDPPLPGEPGAPCGGDVQCGQGEVCNAGLCMPLACPNCFSPNICVADNAGNAVCSIRANDNICTPGNPVYQCGNPVAACNQPCNPPNICTFRGGGAKLDYRCTTPDGDVAF